jgi:hypothetical protein
VPQPRSDLAAHEAVPRAYVKHPPGALAYEALVRTVRAYETTQAVFAQRVAAWSCRWPIAQQRALLRSMQRIEELALALR